VRTLQLGMTAAHTRGGGVDRYYFSLLRELPELGVGVRGLVVGDPSISASAVGVASFAPEGAGMLKRWSALRGAVSGVLGQTDLTVSHFAPYAFPVLDRLRSRPLVVHFHGPWALESAVEGAGRIAVAAKRALEHVVYRRAARFIVLSRAFATILEREYGVKGDRIRIVPGGVDLARFRGVGSRADARRALGWPLDRPTVVTVRRLVHAKGLENLIDATDRLRTAIPDVHVVIVGTGPLAAELQRRVRERGLERWIRFAGYVAEEDLPTVYRAADLFVVPTIALEGFGLVVIEALACGTPVLVTPISGLPEVVRDLDPGLVLAGTSPDQIAQGLRDALAGRLPLPDEDACMRYARRFDWPAIAARVRDVYREVA
jgi:glycosyltransferase involved in cell wall biosynthesis